MKVKTSELTGLALRWASAKAAGYEPEIRGHTGGTWIVAIDHVGFFSGTRVYNWEPDNWWQQAGRLLELHRISLLGNAKDSWHAYIADADEHGDLDMHRQHATTPQVAILRCACDAHFGYEVDIPDELVTEVTASAQG